MKQTTAEFITLQYWAPGPFASDYCGTDDEAHEEAAYGGLAGCLDRGLLRHLPSCDRYEPTNKGHRLLASEQDDEPKPEDKPKPKPIPKTDKRTGRQDRFG